MHWSYTHFSVRQPTIGSWHQYFKQNFNYSNATQNAPSTHSAYDLALCYLRCLKFYARWPRPICQKQHSTIKPSLSTHANTPGLCVELAVKLPRTQIRQLPQTNGSKHANCKTHSWHPEEPNYLFPPIPPCSQKKLFARLSGPIYKLSLFTNKC